jgi:hypothetical protein
MQLQAAMLGARKMRVNDNNELRVVLLSLAEGLRSKLLQQILNSRVTPSTAAAAKYGIPAH